MKVGKVKYNFWLFVAILLYRFCLDVQYCDIVSLLYGYDGYTVNIELHKVVISWVMTMLLSVELIKISRRMSMSALFLLILGLLYFIPGFSLYAMYGRLADSYFVYYVLSCFLFYGMNRCVPFFQLKQISIIKQEHVFRYIIIAVILISIIIAGIYNGFRIKVSLSDVYELRSAQTEAHLPTFVAYFQPMSAMLVPVCIIFYMLQKKWLMFGVMIVLQLMSFAFGGMKATFFAIIIAICAMFYPKGKRYLIIIALMLFSIFALMEFYFLKTPLLTEFITRRISFIPNMLGFYYYDFFSQNELLYWRASILRFFGFENPYHEYIPWLIGENYFGRRMGCNTGMFGEAFSQFGWFASILYSFLYVIVFRFFDACTKGIDERITLTAVALLSISFIDGAFWGCMLTEGFMLLCVCFCYMPRYKL